jgi:hypothetical protein
MISISIAGDTSIQASVDLRALLNRDTYAAVRKAEGRSDSRAGSMVAGKPQFLPCPIIERRLAIRINMRQKFLSGKLFRNRSSVEVHDIAGAENKLQKLMFDKARIFAEIVTERLNDRRLKPLTSLPAVRCI